MSRSIQTSVISIYTNRMSTNDSADHCHAWQVRRAALEGLVALLGGLPCISASSSEALRAETSTPLVAATAMMLQEAASAEASAGLHGSKAVRISALRALRLLYEAVNDAQALSYVLPGAVGGLSKALLQGPCRFKIMACVCHVVNMWSSPC